MKNQKKGFVVPLTLAIITVLVIVGSYVYLRKGVISPVKDNAVATTSNDTCPPQNEDLSPSSDRSSINGRRMSSPVVASARAFLVSKLGQKEYDCDVKFDTELPENGRDAGDNNRLVYYFFESHKVPGLRARFLVVVNNIDNSIVKSSPNSTTYPVPDCISHPQKCDLTITKDRAKAIATKAGLKYPEVFSYSSNYSIKYDTFVWVVQNGSDCGSTQVIIDAAAGSVLSKSRVDCTPPPSAIN